MCSTGVAANVAPGLLSLEFWDGYRVDSANLSLAGLRGRLQPAGLEAELRSAAETVLMASSDKLGRVSPYRVAPLAALSTLIVTPQADAAGLAALRLPGLDVVVSA